jgi:hypothetical protein
MQNMKLTPEIFSIEKIKCCLGTLLRVPHQESRGFLSHEIHPTSIFFILVYIMNSDSLFPPLDLWHQSPGHAHRHNKAHDYWLQYLYSSSCRDHASDSRKYCTACLSNDKNDTKGRSMNSCWKQLCRHAHTLRKQFSYSRCVYFPISGRGERAYSRKVRAE